jgi:hypothetical protein
MTDLFKQGIISYKVCMMLPVRDKVDSLMRSGLSHGQAVVHVANEMALTRQALYGYLE